MAVLWLQRCRDEVKLLVGATKTGMQGVWCEGGKGERGERGKEEEEEGKGVGENGEEEGRKTPLCIPSPPATHPQPGCMMGRDVKVDMTLNWNSFDSSDIPNLYIAFMTS